MAVITLGGNLKHTIETRFIQDKTLKGKRDTFFEGAGPKLASSTNIKAPNTKPKQSLASIEPRLRRLVVRACQNSYAATKVIQQLEDFLLEQYFPEHDKKELDVKWWSDLLTGEPTAAPRQMDEFKSSDRTKLSLQFSFQKSPNSSFHRLLLHALCQFHGLKALAKNSKSDEDIRMSAVTGIIAENLNKSPISLIACIEERERIVTA